MALRKTTSEPSHIVTKMEVMMVFESDSVLKESVAESRRQSASGPHRSPG